MATKNKLMDRYGKVSCDNAFVGLTPKRKTYGNENAPLGDSSPLYINQILNEKIYILRSIRLHDAVANHFERSPISPTATCRPSRLL